MNFFLFLFFLLGAVEQVFRIKPPMCITKEDVDFTVAVMRKAFATYVEK